MSSAISTDTGRHQPDQTALQPWQFFVLAALACATAVTYFARGQGVVAVVLLGVMMGATAFVGLAVLRAVRPLVTSFDDRTVMIGERTRAALEREKMLALRSIKELEFDRAMGKLSDGDWQEMSTRLRARAGRLMRQLEAGSGYREQIEKDLAKRLGQGDARLKPSRDDDERKHEGDRDSARLKPSRYEDDRDGAPLKPSRYEDDRDDARLKPSHYDDETDERGARAGAEGHEDNRSAMALAERSDTRRAKGSAERICVSCATVNDPDARFCKGCGGKL
ncbi:MAG TPA: hypothetical protein VG222_08640 [Vicinamibacterales bacterium]|nr:hypothetical protein [Vicinamibacterales bacterium]